MSDFVTDGQMLNVDKVDASTPVGPANQRFVAAEINAIDQAAMDLRTHVLALEAGGAGFISALGAVGAVPNANAASVSAGVLTLQPADGTHPGLVTTGAQTFGGAKTFSSTISASNLSNTNSGDLTLAAVGSTPSANGAALSGQVLTLQPADGTHPGLVTTGTQTIAGDKTFTGLLTATGDIQAAQGFGIYFNTAGTHRIVDNGSGYLECNTGMVLSGAITLTGNSPISSCSGIIINNTGIGASGGIHLDAASEGTAFINFLRPNGNSNDTLQVGGGRIQDGSAFTSNIQNATSGGNSMVQALSTVTPASGSARHAVIEINPTVNGASTGVATSLAIASVTNTLTGGTINLIDAGTSTTNYSTGFTSKFSVDVSGNVLAAGHLGVGNAASASVIPASGLVKKIQIYDASGSSLGYIPVYSSIT